MAPADQNRFAEVRQQLQAVEHDARSAARRRRLFAVAGPALLLAALYVTAEPMERLLGATATQALGVTVITAALGLGAGFGFAASDAAGRADAAALKLSLLEEETTATERALALAASGRPFALFLRSFAAEAAGLSRSGFSEAMVLRGRERQTQLRLDGFVDLAPDTSDFDRRARWSRQLGWLRGIGERCPVVVLGNTRLDAGQRRELMATGIVDVTVQAQDWWTLFLDFAGKAAVVIFYCDEATPMLQREMRHLVGAGCRYVVVAGEAQLIEINRDPLLAEAFVSGAEEALNPSELARFPAVLDRCLGAASR